MSTQPFTPEFKEEAVKQATERGCYVLSVSRRRNGCRHLLSGRFPNDLVPDGLRYLCPACMEADHAGQPAASILALTAVATAIVALFQAADELFAPLPSRHGIDGGVNGFVGHVKGGVIRMVRPQSTLDLLRGPALAQQFNDNVGCGAVRLKFAWLAREARALPSLAPGSSDIVAMGAADITYGAGRPL